MGGTIGYHHWYVLWQAYRFNYRGDRVYLQSFQDLLDFNIHGIWIIDIKGFIISTFKVLEILAWQLWV